MVKKTIILLVLYFFSSFSLLVREEKNILPRSRVFLAPWSRSRSKKIPGAGAAWEKNQEPEPEPLEKKSGDGAAKKFAGSPALAITA